MGAGHRRTTRRPRSRRAAAQLPRPSSIPFCPLSPCTCGTALRSWHRADQRSCAMTCTSTSVSLIRITLVPDARGAQGRACRAQCIVASTHTPPPDRERRRAPARPPSTSIYPACRRTPASHGRGGAALSRTHVWPGPASGRGARRAACLGQATSSTVSSHAARGRRRTHSARPTSLPGPTATVLTPGLASSEPGTRAASREECRRTKAAGP